MKDHGGLVGDALGAWGFFRAYYEIKDSGTF